MSEDNDPLVLLRCGNPQCGLEFTRLRVGLKHPETLRCPTCRSVAVVVHEGRRLNDDVLDALANDYPFDYFAALADKLKNRE